MVYCMHPRVIALSLMPLLLMGVLALGLSHWYWDAAVALAHGWLDSWGMVGSFWVTRGATRGDGYERSEPVRGSP
ncbi:MAG: hypothetical protein ACM3Q3_02000 [Nitrospirota bacterium]